MRERAHHKPVLVLHELQEIDDEAERLWQREETERMPGGGGVDDDTVPFARRSEIGERQECHGLVGPWQDRVDEPDDVFAIEVRPTVDHRDQGLAPPCEERVAFDRRVELLREDAGDAMEFGGVRTHGLPERGAERARRVGREEEYATRGSRGLGERDGYRRLANAPFPANDNPPRERG